MVGLEIFAVGIGLAAARIAQAAEILGLQLIDADKIRARSAARADALIARANARREASLVDAQCHRDLKQVLDGTLRWDGRRLRSPQRTIASSGQTTGAENERAAVLDQFLAEANALDGVDRVRKFLALRAVLRIAEEIVDERASSPEALAVDRDQEAPEGISPDWIGDWREGAERSAEGELRQLWARLLVAEADAPGSIAKRTLAAMRLLSRADADAIGRIGPLVIDGSFIISDSTVFTDFRTHLAAPHFFAERKLLAETDISGQILYPLQEIGVLSGIDSVGAMRNVFATTIDGKAAWIISFCWKKVLLGVLGDGQPAVPAVVPFYQITFFGRQLLGIANFEPDSRVIELLADYLVLHGAVWVGLYDLLPGKERVFDPSQPHTVIRNRQ